MRPAPPPARAGTMMAAIRTKFEVALERSRLPKSNWRVVGIAAAYLLAAALARDPGQEEGHLEPSERGPPLLHVVRPRTSGQRPACRQGPPPSVELVASLENVSTWTAARGDARRTLLPERAYTGARLVAWISFATPTYSETTNSLSVAYDGNRLILNDLELQLQRGPALWGSAGWSRRGSGHLDDVSRLTEAVHRQVPQLLRARRAPGR